LVENPAAVVILHGSGGIDARGTFYAQKLSERYATLSVEMFQGSIDGGGSNRPPLPIYNYTHAFGALNYLADAEGFIDANGDIVASDGGGNLKRKVRVNPGAVGCLGFSWGGVICNQIATETYSQQHGDALYGTDYRFAAHVAHYPVCWARNVPGFPGLAFGSPDAPLTGRPLLIQIGSEDAYDNAEGDSGSEVCNQLKSSLVAEEQDLVEVRILEGGHHAFDRVFAPSAVLQDPFARLGQYLASPPEDYPEVPVIPDLGLANEALWNIQRLFFLHLR
jgi:dienelactone hydrolase